MATRRIGVHHGKIFLLLHAGLAEGERSIAVDVFGDQHLNMDRSGEGNLGRFKANVAKHGDPARVQIVQHSSLDLTLEGFRQIAGQLRLMSVDGGHTAECAEHDLRISDAASADWGVIILDDYFNQAWPDVSVGSARYFMDPGTRFRPFAIWPNKVLLTNSHFAEAYRAEMKNRLPELLDKTARMYDAEVLVFGIDFQRYGAKARLKRMVKRSWIYRALRGH